MKVASSSMLLLVCLLALLLAETSFAADMVIQETYGTTDCTGDVTITTFFTLANNCFRNGISGSGLYTCDPITSKSYSSLDCSGSTVQDNIVERECNPSGGRSATQKCQSFADNRIASVNQGDGCDEDGKLTNGGTHPRFTVIDECIRPSNAEKSYKLTISSEDVLSLAVFSASGTCSGKKTTTTIKVGECKSVSGIITGLSDQVDAFVTINPLVEGTKLGNNAIVKSVNLVVLVVAMVGAMMMLI